MKRNNGISCLLLILIIGVVGCKKDPPTNQQPPVTPPPGEYTASTFAGTNQSGLVNGPAASARFYAPGFIVNDTKGNMYVSDNGNHVIRKISASGDVTTFAGNGTSTGQDGQGTLASFRGVTGIAVDTSGNIYVSDYCFVRKISPAGLVTTIAGNSTQAYLDGQDTAARFSWVYGLAVSKQGNVYVADNGQNYSCIRKISPSGMVTTLAGGAKGYVEGNGTAAKFGYVYDIVVDTSGNLIVNDAENHCLRMVTPAGQVSTFFKPGTLFEPQYLTVSNNNTIYMTQAFWSSGSNSFNSVYKLSYASLTKIAGTGDYGYLDSNDALKAKFSDNGGLAVDTQGNILVADRNNHCIRKIKKN